MLFTKDYSHLLLIPEGKEGAIAIPGSTTHVSAQALSLCQSGSSLTTGDGSTAFASHDRMLFTKDLKTLVAVPSAYGTAVVLPAETESISEYALAGCKDLASITVLGNVQSIDPTAFADEVKASAVVALPAGQDYAARKAVWKAAGFQHFAEPAQPGATTSANTNETSGLAYTLLNDYTLAVTWQGKDDPQGDLEIPSFAEINGVPYRVSTIAESAFANRGSLTSVKLPTTITTINNGAFAGCANLAAIEFPNTLREIGERAFEATSLKDVWLPASINSIGSRAFASCSTLERVVALGNSEVANDALAGCTNVSIYVPSGSEDTWNPGIPSDNNHLMPYGISLSEETLTIEAGQEANLLEGANLQAPDPIEVSYSYAAAPLSVEDGIISAKKAGTTDVTAVLSLDGIELTRATRIVEVSPNPEGEPDIAILNSEVPLPAAYLANARETQLNVTAPVGVTFGKDTPYDVADANPPASMQSKEYFENNMDVPVYLAQVDCTQEEVSTVLVGNTGATLVTNQKLFSLYPEGAEGEAMHFGCDKDIKTASPNNPSAFTIQPKSKSPFIFRLNLTNDTTNLANAKVNPSVATKNTETKKLASLMYTFETVPLLGFGSGKVESSPFYLKDKTTGEVYTAAEVKEHANAIASGNQDIKAAYQSFMTKEDTYECKTVWDDTPYDVRIIGINHDELSERSADGRSKAGLTFQFVNLLDQTYEMNPTSVTNTGGWGASGLRRKMNPGGEIWNMVPVDLRKEIAQVLKAYGPTWNAQYSIVEYSQDYLFLASYRELSDSVYTGGSFAGRAWLTAEGYQYEYWEGKVPNSYGANPNLVKHPQSYSWAIYWWQRSVTPYNPNGFMYRGKDGDPDARASDAPGSTGVCPCFCL
ncbi:leucine-rich repeat protein [Gordonibacter faecis]|uniref:Leucine-rich repeat protein n=2 Tax=Gordonibacter TaxID=644652 RepID=A0ABT7DMX5_9ACTN|nr:leucine-rich repeat protein [Gordonibacter sp. KGMB12511]MDJ1650876.1 leucine-rich repeat protein [Gordonibacter sp. KGMB12511]